MNEGNIVDEVEPDEPGADWAGNSPWGTGFIVSARLRCIAEVVHGFERYEESPKEEERSLIALVKKLDLDFDEMLLLLRWLRQPSRPRGRPKLTDTPTLARMEEVDRELTLEFGRKPKVREVQERIAAERGNSDLECVKTQATRERRRVKKG